MFGYSGPRRLTRSPVRNFGSGLKNESIHFLPQSSFDISPRRILSYYNKKTILDFLQKDVVLQCCSVLEL